MIFTINLGAFLRMPSISGKLNRTRFGRIRGCGAVGLGGCCTLIRRKGALVRSDGLLCCRGRGTATVAVESNLPAGHIGKNFRCLGGRTSRSIPAKILEARGQRILVVLYSVFVEPAGAFVRWLATDG